MSTARRSLPATPPADATVDSLWRFTLALEERVRALEEARMRDLEAKAAEPPPQAAAPSAAPITLDAFKDAERQQILSALDEYKWNRAAAAESLGIPRRTFYRRLKEYGIE